ncbi:MAG: sulfurtransferase [Planctomycetota bacterium]
MSGRYVNIAAYKFVELDNIAQRKEFLLARAKQLALKGTILLSYEGINMFLAGKRNSIDTFLHELMADEKFSDLPVKESFSDHQPFTRMLVRLKKEIISMGVPQIQPELKTSPKIAAEELKTWLDEGKDITLLDVRNDYEVGVGTFANAVPVGVDSFREFPDAVDRLPEEMKQKPVVMFCTGGIRCEKAGPMMEEKGFHEVFQLDGGILKYFEDCGGAHYDGDCFVFDKRVALNAALAETGLAQCYACQAVLSVEEQASEYYVPTESCPFCFKNDEEKTAIAAARRNDQIREMTSPLPGGQPYDNVRPMNVPARFDRSSTIEFLNGMHPHLGSEYWANEIELQRIQYKEKPLDPEAEVRGGWRVEHLIPHTIEPDVNARIDVLYEDPALIAVNKPAPLPMHPSGRFNKNTLIEILRSVFPGERLRMAHRLDANTTGIVLICRKRIAADGLRVQFENGNVKKTYLALVQGCSEDDAFTCEASIADQPAVAGVRLIDDDGLQARTFFRVLSRFEDGTSLLECKPLTGRTNQIRVHLWHMGMPIVGDPSYLPDGSVTGNQTKSVDSPPMCLHARRIELSHPLSGMPLIFETPLPEWCPSFAE